MLTALRSEMQALLSAVPCSRKPALRRTDHPDAILATNLPFVAAEGAVDAFIQQAGAAGWHVTPHNGWLLLDHPIPPPTAPQAESSGELACAISLLARHAQEDAPAASAIRVLAKAADTSPMAVESLCHTLHAQWAEALRLHRPLPGSLLPYLQYTAYTIAKKEAAK